MVSVAVFWPRESRAEPALDDCNWGTKLTDGISAGSVLSDRWEKSIDLLEASNVVTTTAGLGAAAFGRMRAPNKTNVTWVLGSMTGEDALVTTDKTIKFASFDIISRSTPGRE
jgi:hypothetical protein